MLVLAFHLPRTWSNVFKALFLFSKDLLAASKKSVAAYMGEWDLQALEWGHPKFRQRLLQVSLCVEILAHNQEPELSQET